MKNKFDIIKITQAQTLSQLTKEGQIRASGNFARISNGCLPTKRTPLYKGIDSQEVIDMWVKQLEEFKEADSTLTDLVDYEMTRLSKMGPQGGLKPLTERMSDLLGYWTYPNNTMDPEDILDFNILDEMKSALFGKIRDRRPLSPESVVNRDKEEDKQRTSSGPPLWEKRNSPSAIANAIDLVKTGKWKDLCVVIGARSSRLKERFIFIPSLAMNIAEKRFMLPIQDIIRSREVPFFAAYEGTRQVDDSFHDTGFFRQNGLLVQLDYTAMDKHINNIALYVYKYVCGSIFQDSYLDEFYEVVDHILTVPVMIELNKIIEGRHGMPSGSAFTNSVETVFSFYIAKVLSKELDIQSSQGLGDDLTFNVLAHVSEDEVKKVISDTLGTYGYKASADKQRISETTTVYLQRFYDTKIPNEKVLGMYPSLLMLDTAMFPERFHPPDKWSGELESLRWILSTENGKNLPYFHRYIHFIMNGDKFRLGLDIPGFFSRLPDLYEKSKDIIGFIPTYNQESMDRGINDFETVKYLKTLIT